MDEKYLYEVVFRRKEDIMESFRKPMREVWTAATLASRLTSPFFLISEVQGRTYTDVTIIQNAMKIEALSLK